ACAVSQRRGGVGNTIFLASHFKQISQVDASLAYSFASSASSAARALFERRLGSALSQTRVHVSRRNSTQRPQSSSSRSDKGAKVAFVQRTGSDVQVPTFGR